MIAHLQQDPLLKSVIDKTTFTLGPKTNDLYLTILESIVSQQLSIKAADTIFKRFLVLFEQQYPHQEQVLALDPLVLRSVGLSGQKASYLKNVAQFSIERGLSIELIEPMSDEEIIKYLTQIKGVGKWTVEMLLMFALHRPDVLPVDDLGIRQAMIKLYRLNETGKELKKRMVEIAEPWRPFRTLACKYLWKWKDLPL